MRRELCSRRALHFFAGDVQSRNEAGDHADEGGHGEGESERQRIDGDGVDARQPRGTERDEGAHSGYGHAEAKRSAKQSQQQAFGDELADDALPRCTERGTNGEFSAALRTARQQQIDRR